MYSLLSWGKVPALNAAQCGQVSDAYSMKAGQHGGIGGLPITMSSPSRRGASEAASRFKAVTARSHVARSRLAPEPAGQATA